MRIETTGTQGLTLSEIEVWVNIDGTSTNVAKATNGGSASAVHWGQNRAPSELIDGTYDDHNNENLYATDVHKTNSGSHGYNFNNAPYFNHY